MNAGASLVETNNDLMSAFSVAANQDVKDMLMKKSSDLISQMDDDQNKSSKSSSYLFSFLESNYL